MNLSPMCKKCGCTKWYPLNYNKSKDKQNITKEEDFECWIDPSSGVCLCDVPKKEAVKWVIQYHKVNQN